MNIKTRIHSEQKAYLVAKLLYDEKLEEYKEHMHEHEHLLDEGDEGIDKYCEIESGEDVPNPRPLWVEMREAEEKMIFWALDTISILHPEAAEEMAVVRRGVSTQPSIRNRVRDLALRLTYTPAELKRIAEHQATVQ